MLPFEQKLLGAGRSNKLMPEGGLVVVAVSGGPDSMALLTALNSVQSELGITLHACHVDHGLRDDSPLDLAVVQGWADKLGVPLAIRSVDAREYATSEKLSLEDAARRVRYQALIQVAEQTGAAAVATGHTADDQVETILMRILRGTGAEGLTGIPSSRSLTSSVQVIRPILSLRRSDVMDYCAEAGIPFREDPSNTLPIFHRNRLRHQVLPAIDQVAPGWRDRFLRTIDLLSSDSDRLMADARQALPDVVRKSEEQRILGVARLSALHPAIGSRVLRIAAAELGDEIGLDARLSADRIQAVLDLAGSPGNALIELGRGLVAVKEYDNIVLRQHTEAILPGSVDLILSVPGTQSIDEWDVTITAEVVSIPPDMALQAIPLHEAYLDMESVGALLVIRNARPGDRFTPLGMAGTKKLQDFFVDRKIAPSHRAKTPIVEANGKIVWIAGHAIADSAKVGPDTKRVLKLSLRYGAA